MGNTMVSDEIDDMQDQLAEMGGQLSTLMTENETLTRLLTTDAGQAGLVAEIKKLGREVNVLRERNEGLMEEKAAAVKAARGLELRLKKAGAK